MTLLTYQIFESVVREKSFQRASQLLNLTPSAVSHAVNAMEKEVGFPLFNRGKQGAVLTAQGELLLPYVREVLKSEEALQQAVAEFHGMERGTIKIGGFNSVCSTWVPEIVRRFQKDYPGIRIEVHQGTYEDVTAWVKNGTIDLGLVSRVMVDGFSYTPLYQDRLLCVVPKGFPTKSRDYITIEEMKNQMFVTQRECCDADVQKLLDRYHFEPHTYYHVVDDMSTLALVEAGMGICILPELLKVRMSDRVEWYPMQEDHYREIGYAVSNPKTVSPAVKKMIECIERFAEEKRMEEAEHRKS